MQSVAYEEIDSIMQRGSSAPKCRSITSSMGPKINSLLQLDLFFPHCHTKIAFSHLLSPKQGSFCVLPFINLFTSFVHQLNSSSHSNVHSKTFLVSSICIPINHYEDSFCCCVVGLTPEC